MHLYLGEYLLKTPYLITGLLCFGSIFYIFSAIHPESIASLGLYHSYWPLLVPLAVGCWCIARFLTESRLAAGLWTAWITLVVLLKLQHVVLEAWWLLISVVAIVLVSFVPVMVNKK